MKVLKFGGTSVGTVDSLRQVAGIVSSLDDRAVVVVSALGGLTDKLIATAEKAAKGDVTYLEEMSGIETRHFDIIDAVIVQEKREDVKGRIATLLADLKRHYDGVALLKSLQRQTLDAIVSFGERMSSIIVAEMIPGAVHFNSPDFIKTERWYGKNIADSKLTDTLIRKTFADTPFRVAVTGGFISEDRESHEITNLGRGGSDYTAALIAASLDADLLEIWTDVDGFMTADPRIVPDAKVVDHMTFIESMELCTGGAKVIYPPTIYPVFHKNIPIKILNTFNPAAPGTLITDDARLGDLRIKGISSISQTTLIAVGTPSSTSHEEVVKRTLNAMSNGGVSVSIVEKPATLNVLTLTVSATESGNAIKILTDEFGPELVRGELENISATYQLATISIVGERLRQLPDMRCRVCERLEAEGIHVQAISNGTSDTTMTVVVTSSAVNEALALLHSAIFNA